MWITVLLSIIALVSLYVFSHSKAEEVRERNIGFMKKNIEAQPERNAHANREIQKVENGPAIEKEAALNMKKIYEREHDIEHRWLKAYEEKDWGELNHVEEENISFWMEEYKGMASFYYFIGEDSNMAWFTARATLEELKRLEEHAIEPFVQPKPYTNSFPFLATIYDDYKGRSLEEWEQLTKRYATTGWSFMYQLIQGMAIPVLILIGCFIFGNNVSAEVGSKKRGLLFYYVLPVKRRNVFLAKYMSGLLMTLLFVVCMLLVPVMSGLFIGDIGSLKYPVLVYDGSIPSTVDPMFNSLKPMEDTFHFITLQEYIGKIGLLTLTVTIMMYSLYYVLSILVKVPPVTVLLTAIITFIGMKMPPLPYNPFSYIDMNKIVNREAATLAFNPAMEIQNGLFVVSVVACLFIALGYMLFKRIDLS
ncbi:hypothetical protein GCM10007140_38810 [Priestia taiwanensis]|uniref:ABC-2 family transporter protein n=1 Tax=Priestia taiwanensis TaxID=1347902 RepID=A0A917AY12_9BACI|nr:hypothetical protein GCM10007140_38810 [Priestia taiwanensis]